ncbi:hypothetical protein EPN16_06140 [bacterium]|nr:MAG: hypothetical protein EPN16_06140 [bacterium]
MATGQLTNLQKKYVLTALISAIAVYADFTYVLRAQWNNYKQMSAKLRQAEVSLSQYDENSAYYKNLVLEYGRIKDSRAEVEENVYSDASVPLFLDGLSRLANSYEVKIMQVRPQVAPSDKAKGAEKALSPDFHPLFLEFDLSCSYHQLGKFLNALERNPLVEANRINIAPDAQDPLRQKALLTLKVYVQKK